MKINKKRIFQVVEVELVVEHKRGFIERRDLGEMVVNRFFIHIESRPNLSVGDQPKPFEENWSIGELEDLRDALTAYLEGFVEVERGLRDGQTPTR